MAVFQEIGEIRMRRAKFVPNMVVISGTMSRIAQEKTDGHAGGLSLEDPGKDLHRVRFLPLRNNSGLAGAPAGQLFVNGLLIHFDPRRAPIDHAPDRRSVRLSKGCEPEAFTEGIAHNGAKI